MPSNTREPQEWHRSESTSVLHFTTGEPRSERRGSVNDALTGDTCQGPGSMVRAKEGTWTRGTCQGEDLDSWYVPRRGSGLYYPAPLALSSGHFPIPHKTPLPISGAKLQIPTWGKLVQDSSTCGFKVNSFHRKKLNRKSTPFPIKDYQGTLEKGLILELELRNKKRSPENRTMPESKTMLRVRGIYQKDTEATLKGLQWAKPGQFEH